MKAFALLLAVAAAFLVASPLHFAIGGGCSLADRLLYPFFHAGACHLIVNLWCFLALVFQYRVSWADVFIAYALAVAFPTALCPLPTMGLSGVCFALMGLCAFRVQRKARFQCYVWGFILFSSLFGTVNTWLHVWCFSLGNALSLAEFIVKKWKAKRIN